MWHTVTNNDRAVSIVDTNGNVIIKGLDLATAYPIIDAHNHRIRIAQSALHNIAFPNENNGTNVIMARTAKQALFNLR